MKKDKITDIVKNELSKIESERTFEFDHVKGSLKAEALRDRFTRTMMTHRVWYEGDDLQLKQLYERDLKSFKVGNFTTDELNYFWAQPTEGLNVRKIHSGLPQHISEVMVDLLMSNGYERMIYFNETDRDKDNELRLNEILDDNDFESQLQEAIETESWSGGVAFKLSFNPKYVYPIIEVIHPEYYEPKIEAGRIIEDTFIKYFVRNNTTYKLKESYGVDETGGYIRYKIYQLIGEMWSEVSLSELEETRDLEDLTFPGIYEKFSLYKPNKLPNSDFKGSKLGESDYSGSVGLFDAIDEVLSTMVQEFRDGKIKNFWPSDLLPVDPSTQQQYMPAALKKDFIVYNSGIQQKTTPNKHEIVQGEIHSEKYIETYKKLIESVLNNTGLSPQTIGITGLDSTAASEESQELREKSSVRTREKKVRLWTRTLQKLFRLVLMMDDIKNGISLNDYDVDVVFNDYKIQTVDDKTTIASKGITGKVWDIKTAVKYIHDDLTEEEQTLMVVNIKIENGIDALTKEEEIVYKKYVQSVEKVEAPQNPIVEEAITEEVEDV